MLFQVVMSHYSHLVYKNINYLALYSLGRGSTRLPGGGHWSPPRHATCLYDDLYISTLGIFKVMFYFYLFLFFKKSYVLLIS